VKRQSLVMESDRCVASSSKPPHHPLKSLLVELTRGQLSLEKHEDIDGDLDVGFMAEQLREWADDVRSVLMDCNAAEKKRSDDVFRAIHEYNDKIAESEKNSVAFYRQGHKDAKEKLHPKFMAMLKAKMEEQRQKYEAVLAEARDQPSLYNDLQSPTHSAAPALSTLSAQDQPGPLRTDTTSAHEAQAAFWKHKYDNLADQNAQLRKAKAEEPSVQNLIREEVEKVKKHYELQVQHHKGRAEMLANTNAELRRQLQQDGSSPEKRKADGEVEASETEVPESPKRARSC